MKHIVSFSSGLSSAICALLVANRYGRDNTELVFMDTLTEDDDNYRFMNEFEKKSGLHITRLSDGRTPWKVFEDSQIIPNSLIAPCTFKLKIELFRYYLLQFADKNKYYPQVTIHIGYDYSEIHRCEATTRNYNSLGYIVDYPLLWKPYELRPYNQVILNDLGIEPPRMYKMGYTHANCGGCCVKQGQGDWLRTLRNFPDRYEFAEQWEAKMQDHKTRNGHTILKARQRGESVPLSLRDFRLKIESKSELQPSFFDSFSGCVHCGVA